MILSVPSPAAATDGNLRARTLARFQLPLVVNAWLVTLAGPLLNSLLGRAAEPRLQLAAFWLAFTVLLVSQSACLVLQQVTAAARARREPLGAVVLGASLLALAASALVLAFAWTPAGALLFEHVIPTPARTAALARAALAPMALVPPLVALRGVAAGLALSVRRTGLVAAATVVRVAALAAAAGTVVTLHVSAGAVWAAWLLAGATAAEALVVALPLAFARARADEPPAAAQAPAGLAPVMRLALPLAAASLVWTAARPLAGAVLGRLADPELAQAGFGVVIPVLFVSCAPLWTFVDVALVLPRGPADAARLARLAALASAAFAIVLAALTLTPAGVTLLRGGLALPPELERTVLPALSLLALEPAILTARAIAQGVLVRTGHGARLLALSPVKLVLMLGAGLAVARLAPHTNGAALALALFIGGDAVDAVLYAAAVRATGAWTAIGLAPVRSLETTAEPLAEAA